MSDERPASDINDVAPTSLSHLTGQRSVVAQVQVALDAAFADGKKFDSALLVGGPGLGKSQLANVIAQEMAAGFHEVIGQSIKSASDLHALLLAGSEKDVVHVDEAHELAKPFQTALYLAIDQRKLFVGGNGARPQPIPIADFTLLLSTTDEFCLLQPLRDRMKLVLRFEYYSADELTTILRQRTKALSWPVDDDVLSPIAQRARGTPRLALRLLQSSRRVCRSEGETTVTLDHLNKACRLEGIDALGLGPTEQQYLRILSNGGTRLNVIASMIGLPARTISQVTESFLIRAGLITKDKDGRRQLLPKAREHIAQYRLEDKS